VHASWLACSLLKCCAPIWLCSAWTAARAQAESIAFDPGLFPPGIAASNDPVLQTRVHAYADTQRYRIGVRCGSLVIQQIERFCSPVLAWVLCIVHLFFFTGGCVALYCGCR